MAILDEESYIDPPIGVYVKVNSQSAIVEINSSRFINPDDGWIKIDEGYGDKYRHAQANYLSKAIFDEQGNFTYKLVDGKVVERDDSDKAPEQEEFKNSLTVTELRKNLKETDNADELFEAGYMSDEEHDDIVALRSEWCRQLNELNTMKLIGR